MSNLTTKYDDKKTPTEDRITLEKNILFVLPKKGHDIKRVLSVLGVDKAEVCVTWQKESISLFEEIDALSPEFILQVDCRLTSEYPNIDSETFEKPDVFKQENFATKDKFVCLHHHDEFSIKDGLGTVGQLIKLLKKQKRSFCCITNHGSVGGWIKQYNACNKAGIKAIFGMEAYTSNYRGEDPELKKAHRSANHLVLIANNEEGFYNIIRIHNDAQLNGFYYTPRVNREALKRWGKGITASSACMAGEVPRLLMLGKYEEAKETVSFFKECFDKFYLEIQIIEMEEQREANRRLILLAQETNTPLILTCDSHYLDPDFSETHDMLMLMRQKKTIVEKREKDDVWNFDVRNLFYRDYGSMSGVFENGWTDENGEHNKFKDDVFTREVFEEACLNTLRVARATENIVLDSKIKLPKLYDNGKAVLRKKINAGFIALGLNKKENKEEYLKRVNHEFKVITEMGWGDYFLIMDKIIADTKEKFGEYCIGIGRGCFHPSMRVVTGSGIPKFIGQIRPGEIVVSHDGTKQKVLDVFVYDVDEELVEIETKDGRIIRCTPEHKILVNTGVEKIWKEAQHLCEGDDLVEVE